MESHSESTNSGARSDEVGDDHCARIAEDFDSLRGQIAEEFSSLRARVAGNIRYERQMQLMIVCAVVCLLASVPAVST